MSKYEKIGILWYDGGWPHGPDAWQSEQLNTMVHSFQPNIIINNRSGLPEDFDTPEQRIEGSNSFNAAWPAELHRPALF